MTAPAIRDADAPPAAAPTAREQMNIVVIGHVDHGKSTLVGRLLADTNSLPEGKLQEVRERCLRSSRPFEYAFLLDALKDEQSQGITIDSARCFFRSARRDYIIIDAPGHVEFLKNMISGAARAEAGLLVIDAKEGVRENSRRHGYLMSMLGVRQVAVCINKMDLVGYSQDVYDAIEREYRRFLSQVGIVPAGFIPISAREGENVASGAAAMPWYAGKTILEMVDSFAKEPAPVDKALRFPVQDIYKFTAEGDDRRIVAGRIETGTLAAGDEVVFLPSQKRSRVATIETFNAPAPPKAAAGESVGVTLTTQIYIRPGELMCKAAQPAAKVSRRLRVNLFWLARQPMIKGKRYKIKLAGARGQVFLTDISSVLDASDLTAKARPLQVERHDVAQCTLEAVKPLACDLAVDIPQTGRFVIIDNYEIAGGGIILEASEAGESLVQRHVHQRERAWERSRITPGMRQSRYNQRSGLVLIGGPVEAGKRLLAKALEEKLFKEGHAVYYLGLSNALLGIDRDLGEAGEREEYLRRLGEVAHLFADAGLILITTVSDLDDHELDIIDTLNRPNELLVITLGENQLTHRRGDLHIDSVADLDTGVRKVQALLAEKNYLPEYYL